MLFLGAALSLMVIAAEPVVSQKTTGTNGNIYNIEGSFEIAVPQAVAWDVLSDYGGGGAFLSDVKSSVIKERRPTDALVEQEALGKFAMFTTTVKILLVMKEVPGRSIVFTDVLREDFDMFGGSWTITPAEKKLHIRYTLRSKPKTAAPAFLVGPLMEASARRLLNEMRGEMEKRASLISARGSATSAADR